MLLIRDQQALEYHRLADGAALAGAFEQSHDYAAMSLGALASYEADDPSVVHQKSDAIRTDSFTRAREAVRQGDTAKFGEAISGLEEARDLAVPYVFGKSRSYSGGFVAFDSRHAQEEMISTAAEAAAFIGRVVIAKQVALGEVAVGKKASAETIAEQYHFGVAHRQARTGGNQYVAASNAIRGAVAERANGRFMYAMPWLGRAGMSLVRAVIRDRGNFRPALRTVAHTGWALRSQSAAVGVSSYWRTI